VRSALQTGAARSLFVATILAGSFLLFLVQPMVARMVLPRLGGAPNVWNSAMIVYQSLLLAGYAYAHWLSHGSQRRQATVHLALLCLCGLTLPIALATPGEFAAGWEVLWVPLLLLLTIGPVFFAMSAQAPLMQRWFASHPAAGEPWALYAASNVGSFAGLMAYPLLAEPLLSIERQSLVWSAGYVLLVLLVAACAFARWQPAEAAARLEPESAGPEAASAHRPGMRRVLHWIALSAVPSGLMLSTTTHLTTDIFAMPLLWVIPLGLYLLSFVVAFAERREVAWAFGLLAPLVLLVCGGLAMLSHGSGGMAVAIASLALLLSVAISLHSRLYELRPSAARLTDFYLAMSVGGALGGAFTAIAAPALFDWVWEHPLLVIAAALLMPLPPLLNWHRQYGIDPPVIRVALIVLVIAAAAFAWMLHGVIVDREALAHRLFLTIMLCGVGVMLLPWRGLFVSVLAALMLAQGGIDTIESSLNRERSRSYFGIYTIEDRPGTQVRKLVHGTTLHGQQSTDPARAREPTTYYGPTSGVGLVLDSLPQARGPQARVGVVGLGTGTLACYRRDGQSWTFFEIDPVVVEFSRRGTFTYLSQCTPQARMVLGDARLKLAEERPGSSDVLAVDAFSSDAIPLHLITREAMEVYMRATAADGVVVLHISNRFVDLEPVVAAIARDLGLATAIRNDVQADRSELTSSSWVALARDRKSLEALAKPGGDAKWEALAPPAVRSWTDDHASILPAMRWHMLTGM
jgi:spermidine synthase